MRIVVKNLLWLLLLTCERVSGQQLKVVDKRTQRPLENAYVWIKRNTVIRVPGHTNRMGHVSVTDLKSGDSVMVSCTGYKTDTLIATGSSKELLIALHPFEMELPDVQVYNLQERTRKIYTGKKATNIFMELSEKAIVGSIIEMDPDINVYKPVDLVVKMFRYKNLCKHGMIITIWKVENDVPVPVELHHSFHLPASKYDHTIKLNGFMDGTVLSERKIFIGFSAFGPQQCEPHNFASVGTVKHRDRNIWYYDPAKNKWITSDWNYSLDMRIQIKY